MNIILYIAYENHAVAWIFVNSKGHKSFGLCPGILVPTDLIGRLSHIAAKGQLCKPELPKCVYASYTRNLEADQNYFKVAEDLWRIGQPKKPIVAVIDDYDAWLEFDGKEFKGCVMSAGLIPFSNIKNVGPLVDFLSTKTPEKTPNYRIESDEDVFKQVVRLFEQLNKIKIPATNQIILNGEVYALDA